jgi:hypothetical protein
MKDEFGRPFGKKEFFETLIVVVLMLFIVSICFLIPELFPLTLLTLAVFAIAELIVHRPKKKK